MAESTVIREFLVALGYKVDESAEKKFVNGIVTATKAVESLGFKVEATALAVAYGVARFATNLEQLYFASQRTGASVSSMKALDLAAQNFGASVDDAQGSLEGLAAFMRNNPGGSSLVSGWLGMMGISTKGLARDARGELVASVGLMAKLGQMFATQRAQGHTFLASQMAGRLGISDKMMLAMSSPGFGDELAKDEKHRARWDAVAAGAHRFMVQLRALKLQFAELMLQFEGPAMGALQKLMTQFAKFLQDHGRQVIKDLVIAFEVLIAVLGRLLDWLDTHGDEIQRRIDQSFGEFKTAYEMVKPAMIWVYDQFVRLDQATDGWSTKLIVLTGALKAVGAIGIVNGILGIGAGLAKAFGGMLGGGAAGAAAGAAEWTVAGTLFGVAAAAAIGYAIGSIINQFLPESLQRDIGDWEGPKIDKASGWFSGELSKFREWNRGQIYAGRTDHAALDAQYSPRFETNVNVTVHGAAGGDPHKMAGYVASAAERAVRQNAADLTREFLAVVK